MKKKVLVYGFAFGVGVLVSTIGIGMQIRQDAVYGVSAAITFCIIRTFANKA